MGGPQLTQQQARPTAGTQAAKGHKVTEFDLYRLHICWDLESRSRLLGAQ